MNEWKRWTRYPGSVAFMSFYYILLYMAPGGGLWRRVLSLTGPSALSWASEGGRETGSRGFKSWAMKCSNWSNTWVGGTAKHNTVGIIYTYAYIKFREKTQLFRNLKFLGLESSERWAHTIVISDLYYQSPESDGILSVCCEKGILVLAVVLPEKDWPWPEFASYTNWLKYLNNSLGEKS